ncbi:MAG: NAD(P)H-hydrate dehydratase [Syntrophales bacterium]|nr:NAD(P)H-hydrate dehydratase [Syntrophales bacterium]
MKVARVKEMRQMDRYAIENLQIPETVLMENAGLAALEVLEREIGVRGRRFLFLCGQGNNGGDGFVLARQVISRRGQVQVFILGDESHIQGAAGVNLTILRKITSSITVISSVEEIRSAVQEADAIVDALYGTGLNREIDGLAKEVIDYVNGSSKPVLSLDIPSGINGDTGAIMGTAIRANYTVTFGLPKVGNLLYPGFARAGKLYHSYISFPPALYEDETLKVALNEPLPLPPRNPDVHKGGMGDCLVIAGARTYLGAPFFAAMSFLKAGGGYARLAVPSSIIGTIASLGPEIVFLPQKETPEGSIAKENAGDLMEVAEKCDAVIIGPGLSLVGETKELVRFLVSKINRPMIIDGDGLTAIAEDPSCLKGRSAPTCLTPHPGEMARIVGSSIRDIVARRLEVTEETAGRLGVTVVLKGAHSVIGLPDGRTYINLTGNAGMATAGSGDVLTGTIAAMYGQGLSWEEAVKKGVYMHGLAGDLASRDLGEEGITASTIMSYLPCAVREDRINGFQAVVAKKIISLS